MEKLYDIWARRNPQWELRFKDPIIERFTNYKTGSGESAERDEEKFLEEATKYLFWLFF